MAPQSSGFGGPDVLGGIDILVRSNGQKGKQKWALEVFSAKSRTCGTEAAKVSKVTNFQACTRTGRLWTENPAAVRAIAATLREFPDTDSRRTT